MDIRGVAGASLYLVFYTVHVKLTSINMKHMKQITNYLAGELTIVLTVQRTFVFLCFTEPFALLNILFREESSCLEGSAWISNTWRQMR